jgi:hypothetical protein
MRADQYIRETLAEGLSKPSKSAKGKLPSGVLDTLGGLSTETLECLALLLKEMSDEQE